MMRAAIICASLIVSAACTAQTDETSTGPAPIAEAAKTQVPKAPPAPINTRPEPDAEAADIQAYNEAALKFNPNILRCNGVAKQGGALLCETTPFANVKTGRSATRADKAGKVIVGFDRDAPAKTVLNISHKDGTETVHPISVEARRYKEQRIDGLPPSQVSTYSDADLKRIRSSSARKKVGFASNQEQVFFKDGFVYPIKEFVKTSPFGSRRILNGEPKSPHYGVDIAAPLGTPIYAPADGVVGLADDDLYFEGAMVMIDHGQGLNSLYLHVNDIFVQPGDVVKRGDLIAEVGSKGRSTGPHLCWRLKWKKENLDPELLTQWPGQ